MGSCQTVEVWLKENNRFDYIPKIVKISVTWLSFTASHISFPMTFIFHLFYRNIVEGVSFPPIYISPKEEVISIDVCILHLHALF